MNYKTCTICHSTKTLEHFSLNKRGNHTFFCKTCGSHSDFVFVFSNNALIDKISHSEFSQFHFPHAFFFDSSVVSIPTLEYYKSTKRLTVFDLLDDEIIMIKTTGTVTKLQKSHALVFVSDHVATKLDEHVFVMTKTKKEMMDKALKSCRYTCSYCFHRADATIRVVPEHDGGLFTLSNLRSACKSCMFEYSQKRIFEWLNLPKEQEHAFFIKTKSGKACHSVGRDEAFALVDENMATWIGTKTIQLLHHIGDFEQYIAKRDLYKCYYCGKIGDNVDHKTPKAKGGLTSPRNCVYACLSCNQEKADMNFDDFIIKMSH